MLKLVIWCFKPSQPQRIISGLKETFMKRYIAARTSKTEIRPEEQSEKAESCLENLWNEIQLKGPWRQKWTQEQNKKKWRWAHEDMCWCKVWWFTGSLMHQTLGLCYSCGKCVLDPDHSFWKADNLCFHLGSLCVSFLGLKTEMHVWLCVMQWAQPPLVLQGSHDGGWEGASRFSLLHHHVHTRTQQPEQHHQVQWQQQVNDSDICKCFLHTHHQNPRAP